MGHRRSTFLINRRFQLKFAFYVCSWLVALSMAYPLIISNLFDYFLRYLALDPSGPALVQLEQTRQNLLRLIIVMQLILLSLTFLISLFMSHRIAGPLHQLRKSLQQAQEGDFNQKLSFRKFDYFPELASGYNEMVNRIQSRLQSQEAKLLETQRQLEKLLSQSDADLRKELSLMINNFKN